MCTFHHKKSFGRKASSIQVKRLERKGEFEIIIHKTGENLRSACDLCEGEDEPLCAKFCPSGAITVIET
jgi:Fe-S-cluster-containing hydrogenase component 2